MNELDKARAEIDKIDREMGRLFERRMAAVAAITEYKLKKGLPVLDSARDRAVLDKNMPRLKKRGLAGYYASFLSNVTFLARRYQARLAGSAVLACRGDEAALGSRVAALYPGVDLMPTATWRDVFEAVQAGDAAMGVILLGKGPCGPPDAVLDLCHEYRCAISAMADVYDEGAEVPTRCMVLAEKPAQSGNHMALLATVGGRVGRLAQVVEALADEGLVLEAVRGRAAPDGSEHFYYIQMLCASQACDAQALAARVGQVCQWCRVLGVYSIETAGAQWAAEAVGL